MLLTALIRIEEHGVEEDERDCHLGSGSVVSADGLILTNHHVTEGLELAASFARARQEELNETGRRVEVRVDEKIVVWTVDHADDLPSRQYAAEVEEEDPGADLTLLRITGDSPGRGDRRPTELEALELGSSEDIGSGAEVTLFGYPAEASSTDDMGCAPRPRGSIKQRSGSVSGFPEGFGTIEVEARGSSGMSGGSAVDDAGRLIGVPAQVSTMPGGGIVDLIPVERAAESFEAIPLEETEPEDDDEKTLPSPSPSSTAQVPPDGDPPGALELAFEVRPASPGSGPNPYEISVWVVGTPDQLARIESVTYHLHPTFVPSDVTRYSPENGFQLDFNAWGQFEISATVLFHDGGQLELSTYLGFSSLAG